MRKSGLLLFSFLFLHLILLGQEQPITEYEIKTSGLYYYGQGIGENEENAKEESRHELISMLTNDIRPAGKLEPEKDFLADGIAYIFFPRGDKTKALAYVLKSKVKEVNSGGKLQISQVYYEDKPGISVSETVSDTGIIKNLLEFNNITGLAPVLKKMKEKGLLMFGDATSMTNPEKYYFVIFNSGNGEIIAFLDKGSDKSRINLLNNSAVENFLSTYKTKKIVWLQIF